MNNHDYVRLSLELHMFFDRIMKEHALFLQVAFLEQNNNFKNIAKEYEKEFEVFLRRVVELANENISSSILNSQEIVTINTINVERKTNELLGTNINVDLTMRELSLRSGNKNITNEIINDIKNINNETLRVLNNYANYKNDVLNNVLSCKMYTSNYPSLIVHFINETQIYSNLLLKLENRSFMTRNDLHEQELFWNNIMKEHAEFIRGLLDPSEEKLILTADRYADDYNSILRNYANNPSYLTNASLKETVEFRNFKVVGEEGILNCQIRSTIIPLLADHVAREANHFIRLLQGFNLYE